MSFASMVGKSLSKSIKGIGDDNLFIVQKTKRVADETVEALGKAPKVSKDNDYLTVDNTNYKELRGSIDESVDIKTAEKLFESGDENIDKIRKSQAPNRKQEQSGKRPFKEFAQKLETDEITPKEFRKIAFSDIKNFKIVEQLATFTEAVFSLDKQKRAQGILGIPKTYKKDLTTGLLKPIIYLGAKVRARLDIPAYNRFDVYMPQIDFSGEKGKGSMFARTMVIEDVKFSSSPSASFNISRGVETKYPHAYIMGKVAENTKTKKMYSDKEARDLALNAIDDDSFLHLGYNPDRGGFFYDRLSKMPVFDSPFVIQIGKQVYAKKPPKWGKPDAERIKKLKKLKLEKYTDSEGNKQIKEGRSILMNKGGLMQRPTK